MAEMVLLLKDGKSWAAPGADPEKPVSIFVTKVDTGAGEVVMEDDGAVVARVFQDPSGAVCDDSCEWALDGVCDDGSAGEDREVFDDDYGGFYGYDDDYYGGYGYDYYGYGDDDDDFLAPVCEKGTDCTDCGGTDPDAPTVECTNTCQWANDDYCDDTRTSGLCDLGTDCHDCGPASKGNFTTFDDDGWWDDDENYWDDDYDWENYDSADDDAPHATARKSVRRRFHVDVDFTQARGLHQVDAEPEIKGQPRRRQGRRRRLHDASGGHRGGCGCSDVRDWLLVCAQVLQGREAALRAARAAERRRGGRDALR